MDPISTARYGMMAATQQLTASANRVANMAGDPSVDYASEAVTQIARTRPRPSQTRCTFVPNPPRERPSA